MKITMEFVCLSAFVSQRGFAALDMSSDVLKCSDMSYNSSDFYSLQPVHVFFVYKPRRTNQWFGPRCTNGIHNEITVKFLSRN